MFLVTVVALIVLELVKASSSSSSNLNHLQSNNNNPEDCNNINSQSGGPRGVTSKISDFEAQVNSVAIHQGPIPVTAAQKIQEVTGGFKENSNNHSKTINISSESVSGNINKSTLSNQKQEAKDSTENNNNSTSANKFNNNNSSNTTTTVTSTSQSGTTNLNSTVTTIDTDVASPQTETKSSPVKQAQGQQKTPEKKYNSKMKELNPANIKEFFPMTHLYSQQHNASQQQQHLQTAHHAAAAEQQHLNPYNNHAHATHGPGGPAAAAAAAHHLHSHHHAQAAHAYHAAAAAAAGHGHPIHHDTTGGYHGPYGGYFGASSLNAWSSINQQQTASTPNTSYSNVNNNSLLTNSCGPPGGANSGPASVTSAHGHHLSHSSGPPGASARNTGNSNHQHVVLGSNCGSSGGDSDGTLHTRCSTTGGPNSANSNSVMISNSKNSTNSSLSSGTMSYGDRLDSEKKMNRKLDYGEGDNMPKWRLENDLGTDNNSKGTAVTVTASGEVVVPGPSGANTSTTMQTGVPINGVNANNLNNVIADPPGLNALNTTNPQQQQLSMTNNTNQQQPNQQQQGPRKGPNNINFKSYVPPLPSAPPAKRKKIQSQQDVVDDITTLMIRHLPCKLTFQELTDTLSQHGFDPSDSYDFLYLPQDLINNTNRGYAFINMESNTMVPKFRAVFCRYQFHKKSSKMAHVVNAHLQGFTSLYEHFHRTVVKKHKNCIYMKEGSVEQMVGRQTAAGTVSYMKTGSEGGCSVSVGEQGGNLAVQ